MLRLPSSAQVDPAGGAAAPSRLAPVRTSPPTGWSIRTIRLDGRPEAHRLDRIAKRVLESCIAGILLFATLPVAIAVAVAIKLESPGPVLYRGARIGRGGRRLALLKFRKMTSDA